MKSLLIRLLLVALLFGAGRLGIQAVVAHKNERVAREAAEHEAVEDTPAIEKPSQITITWLKERVANTSISIEAPGSYAEKNANTIKQKLGDPRVTEVKQYVLAYSKEDFRSEVTEASFTPNTQFSLDGAVQGSISRVTANLDNHSVTQNKKVAMGTTEGRRYSITGNVGSKNVAVSSMIFMRDGKMYSVTNIYNADDESNKRTADKILDSITIN